MQILTDHAEHSRARHIAIYGDPKIGKTRTATSLPWGETWGEKAVYMAWDPGSAALESVLTQHRPHLDVVIPAKQLVRGKEIYDPLEEAIEMATTDWSAKGYKTIIWDTMTETSLQFLRAYADSGQFSDKHITFGKPGTESHHANAMEGDYGSAQNTTLFLLEQLFKKQGHMNLIILFHTEIVEPKKGADPRLGGLFGGPGIAGKAGSRKIAGRFNNLFRQYIHPVKEGAKIIPQYRVQTQATGNDIWLAGIRVPHPENPIPTIILKPNPVNLWTSLDEVLNAETEVSPEPSLRGL